MVTIKILKVYDDIELERKVFPKEVLKVSLERAKKLAGMRLAEIIRIDKLSSKKNG